MNSIVVVFLFAIFTSTTGLDNGLITQEDFCYEDKSCGPESDDWGGQCQTGNRQSPIDLPFVPHRHTRYVKLKFNDWYRNDEFWIVDNGHTIQVTLGPSTTSLARMSGYEIDHPYTFAQIHFHWGYDEIGSEHSIDNEFYSMEAHLVHYDSKYNNFTAAVNSGDPKALAVVAVFISEGYECNDNAGFDTIATNIPKFSPNPTHIQKPIDLSTFLPERGQDFYRYFGSLTTPECNEVVEWTVIRDPIYVRPSLIRKFRQVRRSDKRRIALSCYSCLFFDGHCHSSPLCQNDSIKTIPRKCNSTLNSTLAEAKAFYKSNKMIFSTDEADTKNYDFITMCGKFTGSLDHKPIVFRSCSYGNKSLDGNCTRDAYMKLDNRYATDVLACFCSGDSCNAASSLQFTYLSLFAKIIIHFVYKLAKY